MPERDERESERPRDFTVTHAHRTALRRVRDEGVLRDLLHLADTLIDAGLIMPHITNATAAAWFITADGRALLAAHDAIVETRRTARPTHDLPAGWTQDGDTLRHRDVERPVVVALLAVDTDEALTRAIRQTAAMLALLGWEQGRRVLARAVAAREARP